VFSNCQNTCLFQYSDAFNLWINDLDAKKINLRLSWLGYLQQVTDNTEK